MAHDTRLFGTQDPALGSARTEDIAIEPGHLAVPGCHAVADRPETGLLALASLFATMRDAINGKGVAAPEFAQALHVHEVVEAAGRTEERRVGEECARTCRSRWSTSHSKHSNNRVASILVQIDINIRRYTRD